MPGPPLKAHGSVSPAILSLPPLPQNVEPFAEVDPLLTREPDGVRRKMSLQKEGLTGQRRGGCIRVRPL
jgi:hypothetical protein